MQDLQTAETELAESGNEDIESRAESADGCFMGCSAIANCYAKLSCLAGICAFESCKCSTWWDDLNEERRAQFYVVFSTAVGLWDIISDTILVILWSSSDSTKGWGCTLLFCILVSNGVQGMIVQLESPFLAIVYLLGLGSLVDGAETFRNPLEQIDRHAPLDADPFSSSRVLRFRSLRLIEAVVEAFPSGAMQMWFLYSDFDFDSKWSRSEYFYIFSLLGSIASLSLAVTGGYQELGNKMEILHFQFLEEHRQSFVTKYLFPVFVASDFVFRTFSAFVMRDSPKRYFWDYYYGGQIIVLLAVWIYYAIIIISYSTRESTLKLGISLISEDNQYIGNPILPQCLVPAHNIPVFVFFLGFGYAIGSIVSGLIFPFCLLHLEFFVRYLFIAIFLVSNKENIDYLWFLVVSISGLLSLCLLPVCFQAMKLPREPFFPDFLEELRNDLRRDTNENTNDDRENAGSHVQTNNVGNSGGEDVGGEDQLAGEKGQVESV